uniref:Uncharacterized protein n=1 Tax=Steinernema glaseri TaxID=37863 RepID=A0A1I8A996_9BILA
MKCPEAFFVLSRVFEFYKKRQHLSKEAEQRQQQVDSIARVHRWRSREFTAPPVVLENFRGEGLKPAVRRTTHRALCVAQQTISVSSFASADEQMGD